MEERFQFEDDEYQSIKAEEVLKATALIYLQDAVENERYEEAAGYAHSALASGATREEINAVIADTFEQPRNTTARYGAYEETE